MIAIHCFREIYYNQMRAIKNNPHCFLVIALILVLTNQAAFTPDYSPIWGSYEVKVQAASGNLIGNTGKLTYSVQFSQSVTNINEISAVLAAYEMASQPSFLFQVFKPTYFTSTTSANFVVQVFTPSRFSFLKFFIVYNTMEALNYFEINFHTQTYGTTQGTFSTTTTTNIVTTLRLSKGTDTITPRISLSSLQLINTNTLGTTTIGVQFSLIQLTMVGNINTVQFKTKCLFKQVVFTIFVIKPSLLPPQYNFHNNAPDSYTEELTYITACKNRFSILIATYGPTLNRNCSIGIVAVDDFYSATLFRKIDLDFKTTSNTSCVTTGSTNIKLDMQALCSIKAVCASYEYYNGGNDINSCLNCSLNNAVFGTINKCIVCNKTTCFRCEVDYYPVAANPSCVVCLLPMCAFCTTATTCAECISGHYLMTNTTCISCSITNCIQCSNSTYCYKCASTYGTFVDGSCDTCSTMIMGCNQCLNSTFCTLCANTHFLTVANGKCTTCSSFVNNCQTCADYFNCTKCSTGYFLQTYSKCSQCRTVVNYCSKCLYSYLNSNTIATNYTCSDCQPYYYLNIVSISNECLTCTITGCYLCSTATACSQCLKGYYLSVTTCIACDVPNCVKCSTSSVCQQCQVDFVPTSGNYSCVCKSNYWQITGVCVNIIGCVTAIRTGNTTDCVYCNSLLNFQISAKTCICKQGYLYTSGVCLSDCGDGMVLSSQQCDDNNNNNDDGCSSTCVLQPNYECGYVLGTYYCIFKAAFSIKLQYILRDQSKNSASYYFTISPTSKNFELIRLSSYFHLKIPAAQNSFAINSVSYNNGLITLNVDFEKDIQNLQAYLIYTLDPYYFNITSSSNLVDSAFNTSSQANLSSNFITGTQNVTLFNGTTANRSIKYYYYPFNSTGTNSPLTIAEYSAHTLYMKLMCYLILGLGAIVFLLSIALQKMIGAETINTIQIIVYTKLISVQNQLLASFNLATLKYINGYNEIGSSWSQTHQLPLAFRRLKFNTEYILNFQTGLILILLSFIILTIFALYRWKKLSDFKKSKNSSIEEFKLLKQQMQGKFRFIYERVFVLFAFIILLDCIAAIRLQSRSIVGEAHYSYSILNVSGILLSVVYIFGIFSYELLYMGKAHENKSFFCEHSPNYIAYYISYFLLVTPILITGSFFSTIAIYIFTGILLLNFVLLIVWRPYKQTIHNFSIIFNAFVIVLLLSYTIISSFISMPESMDLIISYVILALILTVEILALVRLYISNKTPVKEVLRLNRTQNKVDQEAKLLIQEMGSNNPHKKQSKMMDNKDDQEQLIRIKRRLKKQFTQNIKGDEFI